MVLWLRVTFDSLESGFLDPDSQEQGVYVNAYFDLHLFESVIVPFLFGKSGKSVFSMYVALRKFQGIMKLIALLTKNFAKKKSLTIIF